MAKREIPTRKAFRQGELLFVPLSKEDHARLFGDRKDMASLGWQKLDTNVIREGEATGHKHEVLAKLAAAAILFAPPESFTGGLPGMDRITSEDRLLVADGPVEVVHPEHKPLALPKGIHLVIVQREYDETRSHRVLDEKEAAMLVTSRYGGCGRGIWHSILDGTVTIKSAGTCLRAVVCQGQVIEQVQRTGTDCTITRHGQGLTVRRGKKLVKQVFYEPGSLRAIRRGGLWKKQTDLTLCGSEGILKCYSTPGGLYGKEVFTYSNGVRAYTIARGHKKLEVCRPNGRRWIVLEGRVRPGSRPVAQWLNPKDNDVGLLGLMASLDLSVTIYGPSGTRAVTRGVYTNRQRQGRWLEQGKVTYYLSGVRVSRKLCEEDPDQWDGLEVLRIPNAQLRSSFLNKMGYERLLQKVDHEVIDTDPDGSQLLAIAVAPGGHPGPEIDRTMRLLRVVCPSTQATYVLRVPPDVQSCQQARHWTLGLALNNVRDGARFDLVQET